MKLLSKSSPKGTEPLTAEEYATATAAGDAYARSCRWRGARMDFMDALVWACQTGRAPDMNEDTPKFWEWAEAIWLAADK
tara:strand:- start:39 stop:278 length:240 start_codon:yes stop_codon:yes gene_type:complete